MPCTRSLTWSPACTDTASVAPPDSTSEPAGSDWPVWSAALEQGCQAIDDYQPEVLIVSLGVDTFELDPISRFKLTSPDYLKMGERIRALNLPTLFVMEGGYAVEAIGINAVNVLEGFEQR